MRSTTTKNILLINGFGNPTNIMNDLLSNSTTDSNIYLSYPLGVMTLAGWCRQEFPSFNIQIIDANIDLHKHISNPDRNPTDINSFIWKMLEQSKFIPDFISISINFSNGHKICLQLCSLCKEKWPDTTIIAGGVHSTTFTHRLIIDPNIDYIIRGPGDIAFIDLLQCLVENKSPNDIPGVVTGIDEISKIAPPLEDLNKIPPYPHDLIDMEYLIVNDSTNPVYVEGTRTGMIFMSRGCPFGCSFCSANKVHGKKVSFISAEKIINQIEYLINNFRVNTICIMDDLFGADKEYFFEFFRTIKERGLLFRLVVPGGLSIAIFNEEMIDILIKHGLTAVYFPVESGSKYVQKNIIKKRVDLEKAVRLINYSKQKGLFTGINIVIGSPGETKPLIFETYEFIKNLPVDGIAFFIAYPYPGTEMTDILLNRGTISEDDLIEIWDTSTQQFKERPFDTEEISGKELSDIVYDFNIELNFFNNYNMRIKNYSAFIIKLEKIIRRYPFHVVALACRAKCYHELDQQDKAFEDIANITSLVKENKESQKLFERYLMGIRETLDFYKPSIDFDNTVKRIG
jgi:radical SAM superfamily enzyme YgiQ (UPF0313 family)